MGAVQPGRRRRRGRAAPADDTDFDTLGDRLDELGYPRPTDDTGGTGVWAGGPDVLSAISADLTPELGYLALDSGQRLLLASDQQAYLESAVRAASGDADPVEGLDGVVEASGEPLSAAVYTGAYACSALAMARADDDDQAQAAALVAAAGTVDPYAAFAMSAQPDGRVRVVLEFDDDAQARLNADSRSALATGPAVGQGGDFADRFALVSARPRAPAPPSTSHPRRASTCSATSARAPCCSPPVEPARSRVVCLRTRPGAS